MIWLGGKSDKPERMLCLILKEDRWKEKEIKNKKEVMALWLF
jgi:hypothetical protein